MEVNELEATWTLGAWMVVVIVPSLMVLFSYFYYLKERKRIKK